MPQQEMHLSGEDFEEAPLGLFWVTPSGRQAPTSGVLNGFKIQVPTSCSEAVNALILCSIACGVLVMASFLAQVPRPVPNEKATYIM